MLSFNTSKKSVVVEKIQIYYLKVPVAARWTHRKLATWRSDTGSVCDEDEGGQPTKKHFTCVLTTDVLLAVRRHG